MVIVKTTERLYKQYTSTVLAEKEDEESLVSSFDFFDEDLIDKDDRDNYFFVEDTIVRFYKVSLSDDANEKDEEILQCLKDFAKSDAHELRYWFKDLPKGECILKTSWETIESENIKELIYDGWL